MCIRVLVERKELVDFSKTRHGIGCSMACTDDRGCSICEGHNVRQFERRETRQVPTVQETSYGSRHERIPTTGRIYDFNAVERRDTPACTLVRDHGSVLAESDKNKGIRCAPYHLQTFYHIRKTRNIFQVVVTHLDDVDHATYPVEHLNERRFVADERGPDIGVKGREDLRLMELLQHLQICIRGGFFKQGDRTKVVQGIVLGVYVLHFRDSQFGIGCMIPVESELGLSFFVQCHEGESSFQVGIPSQTLSIDLLFRDDTHQPLTELIAPQFRQQRSWDSQSSQTDGNIEDGTTRPFFKEHAIG